MSSPEEALLTLGVNVVTVGVGWLVGQRVISYWTVRQKRKELQIQLAGDFYRSYGTFRTVWKAWNDALDRAETGKLAPDVHREYLRRAVEAEGAFEATLLKVTAERQLAEEEQAQLGNIRQAFQVLHERIRDGLRVSYGSSQHPDYIEFKRLATWFGTLLASPGEWRDPTANDAFLAFKEITDNKYEPRWRKAGM
jgi:hypothetical protein